MSGPEKTSYDRSLFASLEVERAAVSFEDAWRAEENPDINDFLPVDALDRFPALIELVHVELELRLRNGETARVEDYLRRFPPLNEEPEVVLDLIAAEYHLRIRSDPSASLESFTTRFPHLSEKLTDRLGIGLGYFPSDETVTFRKDENESHRSATDTKHDSSENELHLPGYELIGPLAEGGMGKVYQARHVLLGRMVAIKVPHDHQVSRHVDRRRFLREARAAAGLRHQNICPIHEVGEHNGQPFLAMAFIQGGTLRDWAKEQQPNPRVIAQKVACVARAVEYAHQHGIIHRDIKPSNIMVDEETGEPVLMDFGLAKELFERDSELTQSGQVLGTPAYMAPEQAAGHLEEIGPGTDVYGLGALLYELLCGRLPFLGGVGEVVRQVQTVDPPEPRRLVPQLHRDIETICMKALAKRPAERYTTAEELADDLESFGAGEPIRARPEGWPRKLARRVRQYRVATAAIVVLIIGMSVAGFLVSKSFDSAGELATKVAAVEAQLDDPHLTEAYLHNVEAMIDELSELAPEEVDRIRGRLNITFKNAVEKRIGQPKLKPADIALIRQSMDLLAERNPKSKASLAIALEQRLQRWEPVFELTSPFPDVTNFTRTGTLQADAETVMCHPPPLPRQRGADWNYPRSAILTTLKATANLQCELSFGESWQELRYLGLLLNATDMQGYAFELHTVPGPRETPNQLAAAPTFAQVRAKNGLVYLDIRRGTELLRRKELPAASLDEGTLTLQARRDNHTLSMWVNSRFSFDFDDPFPLAPFESAIVGLLCPDGTRFTSLILRQQALSIAPSPMEQGDSLYDSGQYAKALKFYDQQAGITTDTLTHNEVVYKQGRCLMALGRSNDAHRMFEQVAKSGQDRWADLAVCELWKDCLTAGQFSEAQDFFHVLASRHGFGELARVIPEAERDQIRSSYQQSLASLNLFNITSDRISELKRWLAVEELTGFRRMQQAEIRWMLLRSFHAAGRIEEAARFAETFVNRPDITLAFSEREELCWLLRLEGKAERALQYVDLWMTDTFKSSRSDATLALLLERCRIHVAMGQPEEALKDLDRATTLVENAHDYHYYVSFWLMRGFLCEDAGDSEAASEAWKRGLPRVWQEKVRLRDELSFDPYHSRLSLQRLHHMILSSLTGEMSETEAKYFVSTTLKALGRIPGLTAFENSIPLPVSVFQRMWQSQRGRDCARKVAFQAVALPEFIHFTAALTGMESTMQGALGGTATVDQEELAWQLGQQMFTAYQQRTLGIPELVALFGTWQGNTSVFAGWAAIEKKLTPELRGPLCYFLAHRYRRLGKQTPIESFLQLGMDDSKPGSILRRLCQSELDAKPD